MDLYRYTKDERYLGPVPKAIAWLEASKIENNRWARLYEVGTNRPIYGDREDGNKIHYDYDNISESEKSSYGWQGDFGIPGAIARYRRVLTSAAEPDLAAAGTRKAARSGQRSGDLDPQVRQVVEALDEEGRWLRDEKIYSGTFVQNVNLLCVYLQDGVPRR